MRKEIIKGRSNESGTKHAIGKNQQAMTDKKKKKEDIYYQYQESKKEYHHRFCRHYKANKGLL